ncbi:uncharacterized protein EV420DRAFT_1309197 [Desarmillaria tabescens]|uniref:Protein kinase domain-containing protein n=1 Tax=Armillaria tabescens TaxID=1929756 RepID=A0AA39KE05_ARMTA|nr:uncharacterized protein EV420DRAFT_1309197 [Desarmillaria tabescens]KAK0458049.1 hypothetical protein EV420DRAFT_1309197 [Desarmillaria tabescens]
MQSSAREQCLQKTPVREASISTFSSLSVHGLGYSGDNPAKITFSRSQSFPAPRYVRSYVPLPRIESWAPLSLPNNGGHLEIELTNKISEGRVGLVYSARVIHDTTHSDLPELCVKVVKAEYGRTLAREAWFYEQLALEPGCEGVISPRCFGFFTIPLKDCFDANGRPVSPIEPWENIELHSPKSNYDDTDESDDEEITDEQGASDWWLPDDPSYLDKYFKDDDGWKSGSPWNEWRASPSDPLICVLVLEKLGEAFSSPKKQEEEELNDIRDVVHDLGSIGIMHKDLRYNNIVRATTDAICPRHQRPHRWRLIDFDMAAKTFVTPAVPADAKYAMLQVELVGRAYFWGWV